MQGAVDRGVPGTGNSMCKGQEQFMLTASLSECLFINVYLFILSVCVCVCVCVCASKGGAERERERERILSSLHA